MCGNGIRTDSFLVLDKIIYPNVDLQVNNEINCLNNDVNLITTGTDVGLNFSITGSEVAWAVLQIL